MDRFEAMRTLVAAIDGGSLSAASRSLNIPLPTVSRRVSDLESFLGSQLVVRTSRKLLLTEAGTAYVASARRVLEELSEAERAASGEYRAPRGELLVTAPIAFGALNVAPIVHDFSFGLSRCDRAACTIRQQHRSYRNSRRRRGQDRPPAR
ncbi:LysR family transcriptional regulator [Ancylobacter dichloromethanicus]